MKNKFLSTSIMCANLLNLEKDVKELEKLGVDVQGIDFDDKLLRAILPVYQCISCAEATSNDSNLTGIIFGPRGEGNNYINMRDYLNSNDEKATEYSKLKVQLAEEYSDDRIRYSEGKQELIEKILKEAIISCCEKENMI